MKFFKDTLKANGNRTLEKSETALSERSYNDATVRALFRLLKTLRATDDVIGMSVDNRMTSTGLYKVELTASYVTGLKARSNNIEELKSKLNDALYRSDKPTVSYRSMPSAKVANIYQNNDVSEAS